MKKILILLISTVLLVNTGCSGDGECHKTTYTRFYAAFYHTVSSTSTLTAVKNLSVKGIGVDSVLFNDTTVSAIILPLNKIASQSMFLLSTASAKDTLTVKYTTQDYFISLECGSIKTLYIDTAYVTNHYFKSVKIVEHNVNLTTSAKENIQVYH